MSLDSRGAALLIAHEIWGVNDHMQQVARWFQLRTDWEVFTPSYLRTPIAPLVTPEQTAYRTFMATVGIEGMTQALTRDLSELSRTYERVYCLGFSVGATAAWLAASQARLQAVACVYGSRIRDHLDQPPLVPTLVVMAEHEASFDPTTLTAQLNGLSNVRATSYPGTEHGFCNPGIRSHNASCTQRAYEEITDFFRARAGTV